MSRLNLRLPETLHDQLVRLAEEEGVSLNLYIVYALTRQVTELYTFHEVPQHDIVQQEQAFNNLVQTLGEVSSSEIDIALAMRDDVKPEADLNPEVIARLKERIKKASKA
jgi:HicB family